MTLKQRLSQADTSTPEGREELSKWLGEILQPRTTRHWFRKAYTATGGGRYKRCRNCNKILPAHTPKGPCGTDSIDLTPAEAFKWRDWAVAEYHLIAFRFAIVEVKNQTNYAAMKLDIWLACKAQPKHFLKAAAYCVLNEKEQDND